MLFSTDKKAKKKFNKTIDHIEKKVKRIIPFCFFHKTSPFYHFVTLYYIKEMWYGKQPDDLSRGDIVWVEFGINVGTELSDYATKGHYAVVWAVDLGNVIVIPLTSKSSPGSSLTYELGVIPNLVHENESNISYLKLDAIRSISKRRIGRMPGKDGGKVKLKEEHINYIKSLLKAEFID